jgi:uncharacterized protein YabN with tetrapyrrole methylase and pyrophosphatase domain
MDIYLLYQACIMIEKETSKRSIAAKNGSLVIAGSGIKVAGQMTLEAKAHVEQADRVLYVVGDTLTAKWLHRLNPNAESLHVLYAEDKPRRRTYEEMVEAILEAVRQGQRVCAVFYGHPGVFVNPGLRAIARAREEGYRAYMTPGISAEDCLFVDLGLDPAENGCQSYEATDFLVRPRAFDPCVPLILWQVGVIGNPTVPEEEPGREGLALLTERLLEHYPPQHEVVLYEAAIYPVCDPVIIRVPLHELAAAAFSPIATLYVPPAGPAPVDREMLRRLGLDEVETRWGLESG